MSESSKMMEMILRLENYNYPGLSNHGMRVAKFTRIILGEVAKSYPELALSEEEQNRIIDCSLLHDIGKKALPEIVKGVGIQAKKDAKSITETHTLRGEEMAEILGIQLSNDYVNCLKDICRYHHERYDGHGYPDGLRAEEIPVSAQVVGLADAFDNMVSERTFKHAMSCDEAYDAITNGEAGMFSPRLISCFLRVKQEMTEAIEYNPIKVI